MHHRTLDEITRVATVSPARTLPRAIRRQRLERFAQLFDTYSGPIQNAFGN